VEVSGHLCALATLPLGKDPPEPIVWKTRWAPDLGLDVVAKKKYPYPCHKSNLIIQPGA